MAEQRAPIDWFSVGRRRREIDNWYWHVERTAYLWPAKWWTGENAILLTVLYTIMCTTVNYINW